MPLTVMGNSLGLRGVKCWSWLNLRFLFDSQVEILSKQLDMSMEFGESFGLKLKIGV